MKIKTQKITRSALIAGIYIILTLISNLFSLASGVIQIRLSESLTLLPIVFPEAVWGLFIGCFVSNILTGCTLWDVVFGSLTTLLAAFISYKFRKKIVISAISPVLLNSIAVPLILKYAYFLDNAWYYMFLTVFLGEGLMCFFIAPAVLKSVKKYIKYIRR